MTDQNETLTSKHTTSLPSILARLGVSLVVSTYQAGKVILVREDQGTINTHFLNFNKPMGIAVDGQRLTVGGAQYGLVLSQYGSSGSQA